jgi:hypothetical protein
MYVGFGLPVPLLQAFKEHTVCSCMAQYCLQRLQVVVLSRIGSGPESLALFLKLTVMWNETTSRIWPPNY